MPALLKSPTAEAALGLPDTRLVACNPVLAPSLPLLDLTARDIYC